MRPAGSAAGPCRFCTPRYRISERLPLIKVQRGMNQGNRVKEGKGKKVFFFEKKKQKTFTPSLWPQARAQQAKVFWFFFSKKNCFLPSPDCPELCRLKEGGGLSSRA